MSDMWSMDWGLVGDIGGTHARFALLAPGGALTEPRTFLCDEHATLSDAIAAFLAHGDGGQPSRAALAVASTPNGDAVKLTNHAWTFSIAELRARLGLDRLLVVNDFVANALAVPHLTAGDLVQIGGGTAVAGMAIGVIGPGSGLGVSALVFTGDAYVPVAGEGGHVTMPAADAREAAVLDLLRHRFGHVSAERVLSGPGLVNLYAALCELDGARAAALTAAQIAAAPDERARAAVAMFCAMLGTVAGNLALTLGTRGGVYIAGGIVPKLGETFAHSGFRARFEDKGRFRAYLASIPTFVVMRPYAALLGAAQLLRD